MKRIILALALTFILASCAPDPRKQAAADAERMTAESQAASEEQARQQAQDLHEYEMQNLEARQAAWQNFINTAIAVGTFFVRITVALLMISLGVSGAWMMLATGKAYSVYVARRAEVRADLIPMDGRTHTFPLLPVRLGKNIIAIANPNDNSVMMLNENIPADRAKIQLLANVLYAGELGHQARLSHKPEAIAQIKQTQIIESE